MDLCSVEPWTVSDSVSSRRLKLNVDQRYRARMLVLFSAADGAQSMLDGVAGEVNKCAKTMSEAGSWLYGEARPTEFGVEIRRWFDDSAFGEEPGCFSMDLYREGNAVLVSEDSAVGVGKSCADRAGEADAQDITPALAALQAFALGGGESDDMSDQSSSGSDDMVVNELTGFSTNDGNIGCHISPGSVRCDISRRNWSPPPTPASCDLDWGNAITLEDASQAIFACVGDTSLNSDNPLDAGQAIRSGRLTCQVGSGSVRCVHDESSHGFLIASDKYKLF